MKTWRIIAIIGVIIVLAYLLGKCSNEVTTTTTVKTRIDTIYLTIPSEPIIIEGRGTIKYIKTYINWMDTSEYARFMDSILSKENLIFPISVPHTNLIITKAFEARLDTIVRDTYNIKYYYPNNDFSFKVSPVPDTIKEIHRTDTITIKLEKPKAWHEEGWVRGAFGVGVFILGIFVGK
jgi:hypothetical protein